MNRDEFAQLSAGHALNALSAEDEQTYRAALAANPEWQPIVAADADAAATLAAGVPSIEPPVAVRDALFDRIRSTPQTPPSDADAPAAPARDDVQAPDSWAAPRTDTIQTVARQRWMRGMFALAASLVLLVALGFGAVTINEYLTRPPSVVALQEIEDAEDSQATTAEFANGEGTATAYWSASLGQAVVVSDDLPNLDGEETFELWFVREDGAVSAGLYDPTAADEPALLDGEFQEGDALAMTIEPAGGSPTGQPTSDPIVVIPTA